MREWMLMNTNRRHETKFREIFQQAGLRIKKTELQRGLPSSSPRKLFPVRTYALQAKPTDTFTTES